MKTITLDDIISIISNLNSFVDDSEQLIRQAALEHTSNVNELLDRYNVEKQRQEVFFNQQCSNTISQSEKLIKDARAILLDIQHLEFRLSKMDKNYVKFKQKNQQHLSVKSSDKYSKQSNHEAILNQIKSDFDEIFKKYSDNNLPKLLDDLHYFVSSQRKKDYEELIILSNTVTNIIEELKENVSWSVEEELALLEKDNDIAKNDMTQKYNSQVSDFELAYSEQMLELKQDLGKDCDALFDDNLVKRLHELSAIYTEIFLDANASELVSDIPSNLLFIYYPVSLMVSTPLVETILKQKFSFLCDGDSIIFPVKMFSPSTSSWIVTGNTSDRDYIQNFINTMMYSLLTVCPVGGLTFKVFDFENRGNSISPFFDIKMKLPDLFGDTIVIDRRSALNEVDRINKKIETILQTKLRGQFDNIFSYARNNPSYVIESELLVLYDFPKGFDEYTLEGLKNIIQNGGKCGIYVLAFYNSSLAPQISNSYQNLLQLIVDSSQLITHNDQHIGYKGLPVNYLPMPRDTELATYFNRYLILYDQIKNRGLTSTLFVKKLLEEADSAKFTGLLEDIVKESEDYENNYSKVPPLEAQFTSFLTLGNMVYPSNIFMHSLDYMRIVDSFSNRTNITGDERYVMLPFTLSLQNPLNIMLYYSETSNKRALEFSHHMIWSFLSFMPVNKVNICLFDPEQRGGSVVPFLGFRKKAPEVFDQKIYTSSSEIKDRLGKINHQIDEFIQEKLGNQYRDFFDYNNQTKSRLESATILVLYDFPRGLDKQSIDALLNILQNGNKCGIFTVICCNSDIKVSSYDANDEKLTQLQKYCLLIDCNETGYALLPYNLQLNIPKKLTDYQINKFVGEYIEKSEILSKRSLSFRDILSENLFSMDSSQKLQVPVGVGDNDSIISLTFGEGSSHHALVAGATGSGKSTLLHTLIMSSMLHYSPDQLHLYLMDFKSGTEFKIYESVNLPHIKLLALDAMQEFGESILENLILEMKTRASLFKESGQTNLKGYKEATGKELPRILVIMDEFQILFNDSTNRKVAVHCAELTKKIVTEGRAFGVHLLMATQSTKVISELTLSHGTIEQMRIRIGLKCGEYDARYLFSEQNDTRALSMMKGPIGTAVMNLDYTEHSNIVFRATYCDDDTQRDLLELISTKYADNKSRPQVFEGGRTTELLDYFDEINISLIEDSSLTVHMGTLIKVAPPFALKIDRRTSQNLLICGNNECMSTNIIHNYIISSLLNKNVRLYFIDGECIIDDDKSGDYRKIHNIFPRFKYAEDRFEVIKYINEIYQHYLEAKKYRNNQIISVVIKNLQYLDIIQSMLKGDRVDEKEFHEENLSDPFESLDSLLLETRRSKGALTVGDKLLKLITDGTGYGIHFVISSLDYQVVKDTMYFGEQTLSKFPKRIVFSLSNNEADYLIDNISVSHLRDETVYYTDGVKNTFQMKPYVAPSGHQIYEFLSQIVATDCS